MRHPPPIVWEIVEAEDEAWEELTAAPPEAAAPRPRGAPWAILAGVVGVLTLVLGLRLWQEADQGATLVERDIGQVVQRETVQARLQPSSGLEDAAVQAFEFNFAGAMAHVVVTTTTPDGQSTTYTETRFYQRRGARWERCAPIRSFWGSAATFDTATLHFAYFARDQDFVDQYAPALDAHHQAVRTLLGLPSLSTSERITISIVPYAVVPGRTDGPSAITMPSPLLLKVTTDSDAGALLNDQLVSVLNERIVEKAIAQYQVQTEWAPTVAHLELWLAAHAGDLPGIVAGRPVNDAVRQPESSSYLLASLRTATTSDYYPGHAEYRSQIMAGATHAFYDFLILDVDGYSLPPLLAAFGAHSNWSTVSCAAFGVSEAELQAAWNAYLHTSAGTAPPRAEAVPD